MATIQSNGVNLYVEDTGGEGRPIVLIHGWPLSAESWTNQVAALAEAGHRVISYDRRGFGRSDKPDTGYDYDTLAEDLAGILDALDLDEVTLVGFSMGGGEVARYLGTRGSVRIHSAVFAAAVPPFLLKTDDNPEGGLSDDDIAEMKTGADSREQFLQDFATTFYSADGELVVGQDEVQAWLDLAADAKHVALKECIDAFGRTDFRQDLQQIDVPVLVLHGTSDAVVPIEVSGERTAQIVENARFHPIEGAPHGCNVSHVEEFNAALLHFVSA